MAGRRPDLWRLPHEEDDRLNPPSWREGGQTIRAAARTVLASLNPPSWREGGQTMVVALPIVGYCLNPPSWREGGQTAPLAGHSSSMHFQLTFQAPHTHFGPMRQKSSWINQFPPVNKTIS
jgi:hypothetical protein